VAAAVPCQFCTKSFGSYPAYQAHLKSHEESLKCDEEGCDYVTHSVKYLKQLSVGHVGSTGGTVRPEVFFYIYLTAVCMKAIFKMI
jgi:hypothetical protein